MGVSIRAYARRRGVAESTVRKALQAGRIMAEADGTIDPAKAAAAWGANTDAAKRHRRKAVPKAALAAARETLQESGQRPAGPGMTFMEERTASEVLRVQTARINLQRLKGEVIDRARAIAHAFRFAREIRDAWLNCPRGRGQGPQGGGDWPGTLGEYGPPPHTPRAKTAILIEFRVSGHGPPAARAA